MKPRFLEPLPLPHPGGSDARFATNDGAMGYPPSRCMLPVCPSALHQSCVEQMPNERPRTSEPRLRPPVETISFPAQLRLRASGESAGPRGPFADQGEAFVFPLRLQNKIAELAISASKAQWSADCGTRLTAWALVPECKDGIQLLEPLVARRLDQTLAVEPVQMLVTRPEEGSMPNGSPLRYGECFHLRAAGLESLYLGHAGSAGGTCWLQSSTKVPPTNARFAAHGGELGEPILFGRPLSLQCVASPPPEEESDLDSDSDDCLTPRAAEDARIARLWANEQHCAAGRTRVGGCNDHHKSGSCLDGSLFSRLADVDRGVFRATLLPVSCMSPE